MNTGLPKKYRNKVCAFVALCFVAPVFLISCTITLTNPNYKDYASSQTDVNAVVEAEDEAAANKTETQKPLPFNVSSEISKLQLGEIAKDGDFYYGLACVRSLDRVQTAISSYSVEISDSQEVIYPIIEIYNGGDKELRFNKSDIAIYADSVKGTDPDTMYLVGVDGIKQLQSYKIDPSRTALVIDAFVVDKGWSELTIFCGNISWTLTPDSISLEEYTFKSLFNLAPEYLFTTVGSKIYEDKYELIFDGMEIYEYKKSSVRNEKYAVFEFTINNTSDSTLDYSLVGYSMKGYRNAQLLDDATYTMDDTINGYTNVYDIGEVHAGMTAKVYVAFEISEESGVFECLYDVGYIDSERLGYVCFNNEAENTETTE